jgi:hypothetical protein
VRAGTSDADLVQFQRQLRDLLDGGLHALPEGLLYAAVLYDEDDDAAFLRRLHLDLYGDLP